MELIATSLLCGLLGVTWWRTVVLRRDIDKLTEINKLALETNGMRDENIQKLYDKMLENKESIERVIRAGRRTND